jgi:hypothetical protein
MMSGPLVPTIGGHPVLPPVALAPLTPPPTHVGTITFLGSSSPDAMSDLDREVTGAWLGGVNALFGIGKVLPLRCVCECAFTVGDIIIQENKIIEKSVPNRGILKILINTL